MKTCVFLVLLVCLTPAAGLAQPVSDGHKLPKTFIGLSMTGNQSWLVNHTEQPAFASVVTSSTSPKFGYKFGISIYHELSSHFFLESTPAYVFQQSNTKQNNPSADESFLPTPILSMDYRSSFSWMELPIAINYSYSLSRTVSLFAGTGLAVRKLVKSELKATATLANGYSASGTVDGHVNEWNWFPSVNFGTVIRTSEISRLTIKLNLETNLSKLYKSPEPLPPDVAYQMPEPDYSLNSFSLSIAYSVNLRSLK